MPRTEIRCRIPSHYSVPCGRVVPIGGQVEPSAQLKAGRFLTNVPVPTGVQPGPRLGGRAHRSIVLSVGPTSYDLFEHIFE
jgi:hypothetical protein